MWTLRLISDNPVVDGLMATEAWETKEGCYQHHWVKGGDRCRFESYTLEEYIRRHLRECRGMNPFWDLGRLQALEKLGLLYLYKEAP